MAGKMGGKIGQLTGQVMHRPTTTSPLLVPFPASVYNGTGEETRVNIEYDLSDEQASALEDIDDSIVEQVAARSQEIFKKQMTVDAVREKYTPLVKRKEGYRPRLKTKIDLSKVRVWTTDKTLRPVPVNKFKGALVYPHVRFRNLWVMAHGFGLSADTIDIMMDEEVVEECPF